MTEPVPAAPAAAGRQRTMIVVLVVLGLIVLGFLATKLLGGGGGSSSSTPTTISTSVPRTTTTTAKPGAAETFEVFSTKNPFLPLKGAPGATPTPAGTSTGSGTGTGTTGTTTGTGTGTGTGIGTTVTTTRSGTGTTATTSAGSNQPAKSQRVSLLDVFAESGKVMANVKVNDTVYKVAAGDAFATNFKAVSLAQSTGCGQFLFGDDQFRLCKGEQVLK